MNFQIIERTEDTTTIQIHNVQIKPLSYILIKSSYKYCPKFLTNFKKLFKNKMVTFFLENFLLYLDKTNQKEEYLYLNSLKNKRQSKQLALYDLVQMFKHKPQEKLQHLWLEYLECEAAIDVYQLIYSKKVKMDYLRTIEQLQFGISYKYPYRYFYRMFEMNDEEIDYSDSLNDNDKNIIRNNYKFKLDDFLKEVQTKTMKKIKIQQ